MILLALAVGAMACNPLDANQRPFVFIVEDDANDEYMTLRAVRELAKTTEVAKDGQTAVLRLQELCQAGRPPDVVLLDLKLPYMNGVEVLTKLREDPLTKHLTIVVLTSSLLESDSRKCVEADQFITKPVDYHKYIESVEKAVRFALLRLG